MNHLISFVRQVIADYILRVAIFIAPKQMKDLIYKALAPAMKAYADELRKELESPQKGTEG